MGGGEQPDQTQAGAWEDQPSRRHPRGTAKSDRCGGAQHRLDCRFGPKGAR